MYKDEFNLTSEMILEKDFKIDTRGYRLKEVDQFLDLVIADYEHFYTIIRNLEKEKEDNLEQIINLKQEIRNLKTNVEIVKAVDNMPSSGSNLDVLKRLSRLEKVVYGKQDDSDQNE
ncbi:MAG: cell division regulator GpsB [Erysipelotrichaceae bacterium]|nr:cell division regulator GpsB [Erysipelotrichaceae bacterium]